MELEDLKGAHILQGIDRFNDMRREYDFNEKEDCEVVRFVLDGRSYEVWENPSDGYRSNHEGPKKTRAKIKNTFQDIPVFCVHNKKGDWQDNDILEFYAIATSEIVLRVGTSNVNDYYPCWICEFSAEELTKATQTKGPTC